MSEAKNKFIKSFFIGVFGVSAYIIPFFIVIAVGSLLFSKDDVNRLSVDEMDEIINEKFRRDEYAWNKEKKIKWETKGRICHRLEDMCYKCPKCGSENIKEEKFCRILGTKL